MSSGTLIGTGVTFFTLKAFHDSERLTFPLLSDFNKDVIQAYGAYNPDMIGLKGIAKRSTFVIDKDGVIRARHVGYAPPEFFTEKVESLL